MEVAVDAISCHMYQYDVRVENDKTHLLISLFTDIVRRFRDRDYLRDGETS